MIFFPQSVALQSWKIAFIYGWSAQLGSADPGIQGNCRLKKNLENWSTIRESGIVRCLKKKSVIKLTPWLFVPSTLKETDSNETLVSNISF